MTERRQARAGRLFVLPALALIFVFFVIPVVAGFFLSLTDFDIYAIGDLSVARFVGAANYTNTLQNPAFWNALKNTFFYVLLGGPLSVLTSLGAALLLASKLARFKGFFRTVYFAPVVTTLVAVAIVWRYLYHPTYGLIDHGLMAIGLPAIDWLGDPRFAMFGIVLLAVWKNFGYNMLIFLAGLSNIPDELYEAAELDGAGAWSRFMHVTLPSLAPTFLFVAVITMIGHFQVFSEPYVMTQGGPLQSTTTIVLLMYQEGFRWWRIGGASAIAFLLFAIVLAATLLQLRLFREDRR
ncbi:MAG: carbohydrate ABC transporter permease [Candidatus Eiseniibacteriota bacterium]